MKTITIKDENGVEQKYESDCYIVCAIPKEVEDTDFPNVVGELGYNVSRDIVAGFYLSLLNVLQEMEQKSPYLLKFKIAFESGEAKELVKDSRKKGV